MARLSLLKASMEQMEQDELNEINDEITEGLNDAPAEVAEQEVQDMTDEINEEISDNDRIIETVDALESLMETVSQMPEDLSETDQAMIRNTVNMAVTGTDIEADELTPGLESFTTRTAAMEGIADTIKNMVSSVFDSNEKILGNSERKFMTFSGQVEKIRDWFDDIKKELSSYEVDPEAQVEVYLGRYLNSASGEIKDTKTFLKAFYQDSAYLRDMLEAVMDASSVIDGMMSSTMKSFTSKEKYYQVMNDNYKKLREDFMIPLSKLRGVKRTGGDEVSETYQSQALMGMDRFVLGIPKAKELTDLDTNAVRSAIDSIEMHIVSDPKEQGDWKQKKVTFKGFSSKEFQDFYSDIDNTLNVIVKFVNSEARVIKNRRNLLRNVEKGLIVAAPMFFTAFGTANVAGGLAAKAAGKLGAGLGGRLAASAVGSTAAIKSGTKASMVVGSGAAKVADVNQGMMESVHGFLFNSLRLHYKTTKIYNAMTNGVCDTMIDRINLGHGVLKKVAIGTMVEVTN